MSGSKRVRFEDGGKSMLDLTDMSIHMNIDIAADRLKLSSCENIPLSGLGHPRGAISKKPEASAYDMTAAINDMNDKQQQRQFTGVNLSKKMMLTEQARKDKVNEELVRRRTENDRRRMLESDFPMMDPHLVGRNFGEEGARRATEEHAAELRRKDAALVESR